jgi:polar amino acid transport system substrate-binding protein
MAEVVQSGFPMRLRASALLAAGMLSAGFMTAATTVAAQEGPLVGGADVGNAPYIMQKPDGTYEGFDVDRLAEIARRLGRPGYKLVDQQWSGIFAGLNAKRFDLIMASTVITKERAESVLFTEGDHGNDYRFLTASSAPEVKSLDDLRGKVIAVNQGNVYDRYLAEREAQYGWKIERYAKNEDAVQAVLGGRAFANLASAGSTAWTALKNPRLKASLVIDSGQTKGMVFRKDDAELRNKVEAVLECMKLDGTIAKLHAKWLGFEPDKNSRAYAVKAGWGEPDLPGYDPTPHTPNCK